MKSTERAVRGILNHNYGRQNCFPDNRELHKKGNWITDEITAETHKKHEHIGNLKKKAKVNRLGYDDEKV